MLVALEILGEWSGELLVAGLLATLGDCALGVWRARSRQVARGSILAGCVVVIVGLLFVGHLLRAYE